MLKYLIRGVLAFIFCYSGIEIIGSELPSVYLSDSTDVKAIIPRNLQRSTSLNEIQIIVPEEQEWKDLAIDLQSFIRQRQEDYLKLELLILQSL
jgi:hypothetical protein